MAVELLQQSPVNHLVGVAGIVGARGLDFARSSFEGRGVRLRGTVRGDGALIDNQPL